MRGSDTSATISGIRVLVTDRALEFRLRELDEPTGGYGGGVRMIILRCAFLEEFCMQFLAFPRS